MQIFLCFLWKNLYISKKTIIFAPDLGAEAQARAYMRTKQ